MKPESSNPPEPFPREPIPPDLLAWARQTFDEGEFLSDIREMEAKGGMQLEEFIAEIAAQVEGVDSGHVEFGRLQEIAVLQGDTGRNP